MSKISSVILCCLAFLAVCQGRTGFGPGEQDWGFSEVRPGAHLFWWLFYTSANVDNYEDRPLVLWLQGGPGASSAFGLFTEIGPLHLNLTARDASWVKHVNLLIIDNPVGTGYSYVEDSSLYVDNNIDIGTDLVALMKDFYTKFPQFQPTPMYIFCESYGGKMTIEFARQLTKSGINMNFVGVELGDSWIAPVESVMTWAPFLQNLGIVDQNGYDKIDNSAKQTRDAANAGNWASATDLWGYTEYVVMDVSSNVDFYNVLYKIPSSGKVRTPRPLRHAGNPKDFLYRRHVFDRETRDDDADLDKLMNGDVKTALNISSNIVWGSQSGPVFNYLSEDFMKPVTSVVEEVLDTTTVEVYVVTAQLDLIVDTPGTVNWVDALQWSGSSQWASATRHDFAVNGILEGYYKSTNNLYLYWIDRAGHMFPTDNPDAGIALLKTITKLF